MHSSLTKSQTWLLIAFSYFALSNIFDLSSTILALKLGLQETNAVLLSISSLIGLGLVTGLLIVKVLVMLGAGVLVLAGVRSSSSQTRTIALLTIAGFTSIFAFAALNNFAAIIWAL